MSGVLAADELIDLAARILWTHAIGPQHVECVLKITRSEAEELIRIGRLAEPLGAARYERLLLFVNLLERLEHRLRHDSRAIRDALEAPLDALGGSALADRLRGSLDELRGLRHAIEAIPTPKERWFRIGH